MFYFFCFFYVPFSVFSLNFIADFKPIIRIPSINFNLSFSLSGPYQEHPTHSDYYRLMTSLAYLVSEREELLKENSDHLEGSWRWGRKKADSGYKLVQRSDREKDQPDFHGNCA